jgi:phage gp36-like protein
MPYSDLTALYSALPESDVAQLTDDTNGTVVNEDRVNEAIAKADALIDAFLPAEPIVGAIPQIITQLSTSLAIYFLYERQMGTNMPDSIENSYKRQMDLLKLIQSGRMQIGLSVESSEVVGGVFHKTNKTSDDRIFSSDVMDLFL